MALAFNRTQRVALLIGFILLLVFRLPNAWLEGRFQDEEATVFLAYAWHHPWIDALFRPFAGYLNIAANGLTLLVVQLVRRDILALEYAPYVTMLSALAVQSLPAFIILNGRAAWLEKRVAVVAALLFIAMMPATEEVFYNALHIQFHLTLCVALILSLELPKTLLGKFGQGAVLFAAPLCGPGAIALAPLFALRTYGSRQRWWQMAVLVLTSAIQLAIFYEPSPVRGNWNGPETITAAMAMRFVITPVYGVWLSNQVANAIFTSPFREAIVWAIAGAMALIIGGLFWLVSRQKDSAVWFALSALLISIATFGFGFVSADPNDPFSVTAGERYNFLPAILFALTLLVIASRQSEGAKLCTTICSVVALSAVVQYRFPLVQISTGPSWTEEVRRWRLDRSHALAVWPRPWAADLSDVKRVCAKPVPPYTQSKDPRYCESGWLGDFYRRPNTKP